MQLMLMCSDSSSLPVYFCLVVPANLQTQMAPCSLTATAGSQLADVRVIGAW
jgi:hypothetical protein